MIRDHEAVNVQALDLLKKLNLTPEDNATSKALTDAAAKKRDELAGLEGVAFDKAYVGNEVAYHAQVNEALENCASTIMTLSSPMMTPVFGSP
jgi:putative membrane protein